MNQLTRPLLVPITDTVDFPFYPHVPDISLELTANCNLKCPYCANGTLTRPKEYIEWDLLEKIVDEAADGRLNIATLHGVGEPLLWDRLEDVIRLIRSRNAGVASFGTNGTLLFEDRFRKLLDAGLTQIYISIDSLDPAIYKATRGGKLSKVIENIRSTIRMAPANFQITVALMNHKDQHLDQRKVDEFNATFGQHPNVVLNLVENQYFPGAGSDYRVKPDKLEQCFSPANYLFIATDGRAAICCMDQDVKHCLGNVKDRSIREIWFDPANQTTFRNVALGVFACPDACVKDCVLKEPKQDVTGITIGYGLPFEDSFRFAQIMAMNGEVNTAQHIAGQLMTRDPRNAAVMGFLQNLQGAGQRSAAE